jgi:hypothetical protein
LPRKVTKRNRPRFAAAARCPALLDWSGGCGTRTIRCASTCSNSPRRNPLTSLRYSAAHRGSKAKTQNLKIVGWARCAHHLLNCRVGSPYPPCWTNYVHIRLTKVRTHDIAVSIAQSVCGNESSGMGSDPGPCPSEFRTFLK